MKSWLLLIAAVGLAAVLLSIDGPDGGDGTFPVQVIGPEGQMLAANVTLDDATVYAVLESALGEAGIAHSAQGTGESLFVTRIGGYSNEGAGGWCFDVWEDGWHRPALGAGAYGLQPGQATRWVYEADGCGALG